MYCVFIFLTWHLQLRLQWRNAVENVGKYFSNDSRGTAGVFCTARVYLIALDTHKHSMQDPFYTVSPPQQWLANEDSSTHTGINALSYSSQILCIFVFVFFCVFIFEYFSTQSDISALSQYDSYSPQIFLSLGNLFCPQLHQWVRVSCVQFIVSRFLQLSEFVHSCYNKRSFPWIAFVFCAYPRSSSLLHSRYKAGS